MDPNTALVFETIGLIKRSLQCSICLDILNDPHSTRCNHQFCSRCIRKVVDERKDKKQEALCPLCKNPITKRSLTSNPRLNEIVDVVQRLNNAFQEDAGIPDSPYPLVNSKLNGQSYLQFCRLNPTPLKPVKFNSPKSNDVLAKHQLDRSVNHWPSNSLHSEQSTKPENVSQQRRSTGFEILSLLESETETPPAETVTRCIDEENDKTSQENYRNTERASTCTGGTYEIAQSQAIKSQENVGTADTKSSGSLTIDPGKFSQSTGSSNNSVSMLVGLLSPQPKDEERIQKKTFEDVDFKVPDPEVKEPYYSPAVNKNILESGQENNDNTLSRKSNSAKAKCTPVENSNNMVNKFQKSPNDQHELKHELKRTHEVARNKSKPSPPSLNVNKNSAVRTKTPKFDKNNSVETPVSMNSEGNSVKTRCDQNSSEHVSASMDSDDPQSYQVIPLPRYHKYSDDEISLEFPIRCSNSPVSGQEKHYYTGEMNDVDISSQDELCSSSVLKCDVIQTEQSKDRPEFCEDFGAKAKSPLQSEILIRCQKSKKNEVSLAFQKSCSPRVLSEAKRRNSPDEIVSSQDELCLPSEKWPNDHTIRTEHSEVAPAVENIPNSQNLKNSGASVIPPSPSGSSFRHQKSKRKRSVGDDDSFKKYARLSNESNVFNISIEKDNETHEHGEPSNLETNQNEVNYTVKTLGSLEKNNLRNYQQNVSKPSPRKAGGINDNEDDVIPPTPPVRVDVECAPQNKSSAIELLNQSKFLGSEFFTAGRKHACESKEVDENCFRDEVSDDEEIWPPRSLKLAKVKKQRRENELAGEDESAGEDDADEDNGETSRSQNGTRRKESVCENERIDDLFKENDGELMDVSDGGRSPIMDDDQMYSSQEDLNVALLKKLAPGSANHKESETESDGEISDCKNTDTTSVSSLTDVDGVEVSTQRIKYLHDVLAHTGGEIEKLTADLKNLKKTDVNAQSNEPKNNHGDEFKKDDDRVDKNDSEEEKDRDSYKERSIKDFGEDFNAQSNKLKHNCGDKCNYGDDFYQNNGIKVVDPSSDQEEEKDRDFDKESNIGDSDEDADAQPNKRRYNCNYGDDFYQNNGTRMADPFSDKKEEKDNWDKESNIGDSDEDDYAQSNKRRHHGDDFNKDNDMKIDDNDSYSDEEYKKHFGDFEEGLNSEKEDEDSETSDAENNIHKIKGISNSDVHRQNQNGFNCNDFSDSENEDGKTSIVVYGVRKSSNDVDKEQGESDKEDDMKRKSHEVEVVDDSDGSSDDGDGSSDDSDGSSDDSDGSSDDGDGNDDEILNHCTLSPPPALDPSTLQLTKLPPAIKNLKKMLQQEADTDDEHNNANSRRHNSHLLETINELQKVFGKNRSKNDPDLKKVGLNNQSREASKERGNFHCTEVPTGNQKNDSRHEGSQKENSAKLKRRSASSDFPMQKTQEGSNQDQNVKKNVAPSDGVLTEKRANAAPKQRTLTSMLGTGFNREAPKASRAVKSSICFVITRLPKQFVSLAGYLAKRNGGSMSTDVTEGTTHIIMPTDSKMQASRKNYTIKYLLGIALGKWIVSQLWITACVKSGRLVDEKQYEVKGDVEAAQSHVPHLARTTRENKGPLLFDSISVVCFGEFNAAISRDQVCQLVRYCGGIIIDFTQGLSKALSTVSELVVICDSMLSQKTELQIKDLCKRYNTFPVSSEWVTDSVANYQLQDIEEYRMDI